MIGSQLIEPVLRDVRRDAPSFHQGRPEKVQRVGLLGRLKREARDRDRSDPLLGVEPETYGLTL